MSGPLILNSLLELYSISQIQVFLRTSRWGHRPCKSDVKIPVKVNEILFSEMWRDSLKSQWEWRMRQRKQEINQSGIELGFDVTYAFNVALACGMTIFFIFFFYLSHTILRHRKWIKLLFSIEFLCCRKVILTNEYNVSDYSLVLT